MAQRIDFPIFNALTNIGVVAAGYRLFVYAPGTSTKVSLYKDPLFLTQHANPVTLNAYGRAEGDYPIYFSSPRVKLVFVTPPSDPNDPDDPPLSSVWVVDPYEGVGTGDIYYYLSNLDGSLSSAASTLNALNSGCTLLIDQDVTMTESVSFDPEVTVVGVPGEQITTTGFTFTVNGPLIACPNMFLGTGAVTVNGHIQAGNYQVFADTITVTYGDDQIINDRWEDATGDAYFPSITETIDLGKTNKKFKDAYFSGSLSTGALTVSGVAHLSTGTLINGETPTPVGYRKQITIALGTDSLHDIDFPSGMIVRDSTNTHTFYLDTVLTKRYDAAWALGSTQGGRFTTDANGWWHLYLIQRDSDGVIDAGFDSSPTAANRPAGWTRYSAVFSMLTNGGSIIPFKHKYGAWVFWSSPSLDIDVSDQDTTATDRVLSRVPPLSSGVLALLNVYFNQAGTANLYIRDDNEASMNPSITVAPLATMRTTGGNGAMNQVLVGVSALQKIVTDADAASCTLRIAVVGYYDPRLRG